MRKIQVIGIGTGNPAHVTQEAIEALNWVDVFFIPHKGAQKEALAHLREAICKRFIRHDNYRFVDVEIPPREAQPADYRATVADWHAQIERNYTEAFRTELGETECGALLVWGDPAFYDSTLRILDSIHARGTLAISHEVIAGISSVQMLAARHRIPLNRIGAPVLITTGRRLMQGFPAEADSVVVMLDGEQAFSHIAPEGLEIFWGAYLGMDEEMLMCGPLAEVSAQILSMREEARRRHGWIMDIYLLRRIGR
ncbi:MAG: precorrin-6A synthase (deacetylating) [Xanthobacter sp.]